MKVMYSFISDIKGQFTLVHNKTVLKPDQTVEAADLIDGTKLKVIIEPVTKIKLKIKLPRNREIDEEFENKATVEEIKNYLYTQKKTSISPTDQILLLEDNILEDILPIHWYNIAGGSVLKVLHTGPEL